jgi:allantoinase
LLVKILAPQLRALYEAEVEAAAHAAALEEKRAAAAGKCWVDVAFWGGAVPGNEASLRPLHEAGVVGFKCFLLDSGVPEFPPLDAAGLRTALGTLAEVDALLIAHAEDAAEIKDMKPGSGRDFSSFVASRPPVAERRAIEKVISAAAATGARAHIVHLSAAECVAMISGAKAAGVRLTAETCPHYLYFGEDDMERLGAVLKCAPPLRAAEERKSLWRALMRGDIDIVGSDHSPALPAMKEDADFFRIWGGVAGVQSTLGVLLDMVPVERAAALTASNPAARFGITGKGRIEPGYDADFVLVDLNAEYTVTRESLFQRHGFSPYLGATFRGVVRRTVVRGRTIFQNGQIIAEGGGKFVHAEPRVHA